MVEEGEDVRLGILDEGNRAESKVFVHEVLHNRVSLAECNVHLDGALAVANVMSLLLGDAVDIGEEGRQVVVGHVLEGELPELLVLVWVVFGVVPGVLVASAVAQPDIVALIGQHEAWGFIFIIDQPRV